MKALSVAIINAFPGKISNVCFNKDGHLSSFLLWKIDQKKAKQELINV